MKKYLILGLFLCALVVVPLVSPTVRAQTINTTGMTVEQLQALIQQLMAQIAALTGRGGSTICWNPSWTDMKIGDRGTGIGALQTLLQREGFVIADNERQGSSISDAEFGETTAAAVVQFQSKYGILKTGYVGPLTRAKLSNLYGCVTASPRITSVSSKAASAGEIYPGENVYVNGSNLSGLTTVYLAPYSSPITVLSNTGSTVIFTAPVLTPGNYHLQLVGKAAETNSFPVFVRGTTNPTGVSVAIKESPVLGLQYDPSGNEASLVANFKVEVTSNGAETLIYKKGGGFIIAASSDKNSIGARSSDMVVLSNLESRGDYWVIAAGKTATFQVLASFNPKTMFAGVYSAAIQGMIIPLGNGENYTVPVSGVRTNLALIVGERSPYITWVDYSKDGSVVIKGVRLKQVTQANFMGSSKSSLQAAVTSNQFVDFTDSSITIRTTGFSADTYTLQLSSPTGSSNISKVTVGSNPSASLSISIDPATPSGAAVHPGDKNVKVLRFQMVTGNREVAFSSLTFNSSIPIDISKVSAYVDSAKLGDSQTNLGDIASNLFSTYRQATVPVNWSIAPNSTAVVEVFVDIGTSAQANSSFKLSMTGFSPAFPDSLVFNRVEGNTFTVISSDPIVKPDINLMANGSAAAEIAHPGTGRSVTLTWTSRDITSNVTSPCTKSGSWSGYAPANSGAYGATNVFPSDSGATYTLSCPATDGSTVSDSVKVLPAITVTPVCSGPYHTSTSDGRCVWSCGAGTTPDASSNQCVCQSGYTQSGTDSFGRITCAQPVTTTPAPASITLAASGNFSQVNLSWRYWAAGVNYAVSRSADANMSGRTVLVSGLTTSDYLDTTAVPGTTYYYQVTASNAGGSTNSNVASATRRVETKPLVTSAETVEYLQFDGCGSEGSSSFKDDSSGRTVLHCLRSGNVARGTPVITESFLQFDTCGSAEVSSWVDGVEGRKLNHCVQKKPAETGITAITHSLLRAGDCPAGYTLTSWFSNSAGRVNHCVKKATLNFDSVSTSNLSNLANVLQALQKLLGR